MRQCYRCETQFEDDLPTCPACGNTRSFSVAGKPRTSRFTAPKATTANPGTGTITRSAPRLVDGVQDVRAALEADNYWDSGIRRGGAGLIALSGLFLISLPFNIPGTWSFIRAGILLVAGILCFFNSPTGVSWAKRGSVSGIMLDLWLLLTAFLHPDGALWRVLTEIAHLVVLSGCAWLLHHDGIDPARLRRTGRLVLGGTVAYAVILVSGAIAIEASWQDSLRQGRDQLAEQYLGNGEVTIDAFLEDDRDSCFMGRSHDESLKLVARLKSAGAKEIRPGAVHDEKAGVLVITLPPDMDTQQRLERIAHQEQLQAEDDEDTRCGNRFLIIAGRFTDTAENLPSAP